MSKSTAQLRKELAETIECWHRTPGDEDAAYLMARAGSALLAALDAQPSRAGKPYRVTYQHQTGDLAGQVFKDSHRSLDQAAEEMRAVIGAGGRVEVSIRNEQTREYDAFTSQTLAALGYSDIAGSPLYGDRHYSQEG